LYVIYVSYFGLSAFIRARNQWTHVVFGNSFPFMWTCNEVDSSLFGQRGLVIFANSIYSPRLWLLTSSEVVASFEDRQLNSTRSRKENSFLPFVSHDFLGRVWVDVSTYPVSMESDLPMVGEYSSLLNSDSILLWSSIIWDSLVILGWVLIAVAQARRGA